MLKIRMKKNTNPYLKKEKSRDLKHFNDSKAFIDE